MNHLVAKPHAFPVKANLLQRLMRLVSFLCLAAALVAGSSWAGEDPLVTLRPGHPRLLMTDEQLAAAVNGAKTDQLRAALHAHIIAVAEQQWNDKPIEHVLIGPRLLDQSRKAIGHVFANAMAFRLTGDARFAEFAKQEMFRAADFPDWNPSHFLDVAEMCCALGVGYDWLYSYMTPSERARIRTALLQKGLSYARPAYAGEDIERLSFPFARNNWNQVCNGGLLVAALALADEAPDLARVVVAGVRQSLPLAMHEYCPDGAYPEGPVYWGFGTRYNILALAALQSALGHDFGLAEMPAFDRTVLYRIYVQSPTGLAFNYADGMPGLGPDFALTWLGQRFHHPIAVATSRALLAALVEKKTVDRETERFMTLQAVWFPEDHALGAADLPPLDVQFRGEAQTAIFRGAWNDPRASWLTLKAGSNLVNHAHLDLGSFMFDADGVRWAADLGPDNYDLPGYFQDRQSDESPRWQYYRLNNLGHNTITPGRQLQPTKADAPITAFYSSPARAFAITELTPAYPGAAQSMRRGVMMLDRSRALVQDDITALKPGLPLTWRMLTGAQVRFEGPRRAMLTQDGRTLQLDLLSPAHAAFAAHPAKPPTAAENQNEGITALEAIVPAAEAVTDVRVAVLLTPVGEKWPRRPPPTLQPLADWK